MKKNKAIDDKMLDKFFTAKFNFDSIEKALSHARALQYTDQDCQMLIIERIKYMKEYQSLKDQIINGCVSNNIVRINDNWFGILCRRSNKNELLVHPLYDTNIPSITLDFSSSKAKYKDEYDKFIEDNTNNEELAKYTNKVSRKADELLNQFFDCENSVVKNGVTFYLTAHCIQRWAQRINGVEQKITLKNRDKIVNELSKSFQQSIEVYSSINENFITRFFLNFKDMIFFAVSSDHVILSLWKNSFGFSDDNINAQATIMQLQYIKKIAEEYQSMYLKHSNYVMQKKNELEALNQEMKNLETQIMALQQQQSKYQESHESIKMEINSNRKLLKEMLKKLKREESLIFKQHRMIFDEENTTNPATT